VARGTAGEHEPPAPPDGDDGQHAGRGRDDGAGIREQPLTADGPALRSPDPDVAPDGETAAWEPELPSRPPAERDGARMVALNMALNGVPREDTRHHIEQNFDLDDVGSLLDEVYARAAS
jgi:hypothetical protein